MNGVPTTFRRRPAPCSHCGDVVLIAEHGVGTLFGQRVGFKPKIDVQHADPGPDGEVFDAVDRGCRRPRVVP